MSTLLRLTPLVLALLTAGGGCGFDQKWNRPAAIDAAAANDPLAGRWEGTWTSDRTGHAGTLRAIVTPIDAERYHAEFDATYLEVMRFGYGMTLKADRSPAATAAGRTCFQGKEDLGPLAGGVYDYSGTADGRRFTTSYESDADHGRFVMTRPRD